MSLLTISWSMVSSAGFLLGVIHLLIWLRNRQQLSFLLAAITASAAGALALTELGMITATSPIYYQTLVFWTVTMVFAVVVPMTWFVSVYLGTARRWLAIMITALWVGHILLNFVSPGNAVFTSLTDLRIETTFWGESFVLANGVINPLKYSADVASILMLVYVADASLRAFRNGLRRKALMIGGSILFFIVGAGVHTPMVDAGLIRTPYMVSFSFVAIVVAMTVELVDQVVRGAVYGRELASWEKKWSSLLNEIQLAVVGLDRNGRINYVNPFFCKMTGRSRLQLLDRPATSLVPQSHLDKFEQWLANAPRSGPGKAFQLPLEIALGEHREIDWSTVPLRDGDGEYAGMLGIGEDIAERQKAHRELQRTQQQIEHLTRALILGELGSTLAHELNQPLAAILSNAQAAQRLLRQEPVDLGEIKEILADVVADDRRAGEVISRMRNLLKSGKAAPEVFDLDTAIGEVLSLVEGERKKLDATIEHDSISPPLMIEGGRVEIQQVVMNLLVNALRAVSHQPPEHRRVRLEITSASDIVLIAVEDSGAGVPSDVGERIFEPFISTTCDGLGMGLAISRRIVNAHHGSIAVFDSKLGGARFETMIPLVAHERMAVDA